MYTRSIYTDFLDRVQHGIEWKVDLKRKMLISGDVIYINNGKYNPEERLIGINQIIPDISIETHNQKCLQVIENLYHEYKYSYPSEKSEKRRDYTYFKALKADEMTDAQLIKGTDRNYARAALEGFILCTSLAGYLTWDDKQMKNHWFYQGKDKDLIILKKWIKQ